MGSARGGRHPSVGQLLEHPLGDAADRALGRAGALPTTGSPAIHLARRAYWWGMVVITAVTVAGLALMHPAARPVPATVALAVGLPLLARLNYYRAHLLISRAKREHTWYAGIRQAAVGAWEAAEPQWHGDAFTVASLALWASVLVIGVVEYPRLPSRLAIYFNMNGLPTGFAPKSPGTVAITVLAPLLATLLVLWLRTLVPATPSDLDPASPAASQQRWLVFRHRSGMLLGLIALVLALDGWFTALLSWQFIRVAGTVWINVPLVSAGLVGVAALLTALGTGQGGSRLKLPAGTSTGLVHRDDDRYGLGGLLYVNRDDPAWLVPKRVGYGWTINFGHRGTFVIIGLLVLLVVMGPLLTWLGGGG
jgi:uncharacterized membrane protein